MLLHIIVGVLNLINLMSLSYLSYLLTYLLTYLLILNPSLFKEIGNDIDRHLVLKGLDNRQVLYIIFYSPLY